MASNAIYKFSTILPVWTFSLANSPFLNTSGGKNSSKPKAHGLVRKPRRQHLPRQKWKEMSYFALFSLRANLSIPRKLYWYLICNSSTIRGRNAQHRRLCKTAAILLFRAYIICAKDNTAGVLQALPWDGRPTRAFSRGRVNSEQNNYIIAENCF